MGQALRSGWVLGFFVLLSVAAWYSVGVFQLDEHCQIIDFFAYKKGMLPSSLLKWEFREQIRPWFQPFVYWLFSFPLEILGVHTAAGYIRSFRFLTGFLGGCAYLFLCYQYMQKIKSEYTRFYFLLFALFFGLLPRFLVRTSSDNLAAIGCMALVAFHWYASAQYRNRMWPYLVYGLLCGFSFVARFQSGLWVFGFAAWLFVFHEKRNILSPRLWACAGSMLVTIGLCLLCDRWGYGEWVLSPWRYFSTNILQGKASLFGVSPVWGYLQLFAENFYPLGAIVLGVTIGFLLWFPSHLLTWMFVPFVVVHCLVPHKELRFLLFPLLYFFPIFVFEFAAVGATWVQWLSRKKLLHVVGLAWAGMNVYYLAGSVFFPIGPGNVYILNELQSFREAGKNIELYTLAPSKYGLYGMPFLDWDIKKTRIFNLGDLPKTTSDVFVLRNKYTMREDSFDRMLEKKGCSLLTDQYRAWPAPLAWAAHHSDWWQNRVEGIMNRAVYHCGGKEVEPGSVAVKGAPTGAR